MTVVALVVDARHMPSSSLLQFSERYFRFILLNSLPQTSANTIPPPPQENKNKNKKQQQNTKHNIVFNGHRENSGFVHLHVLS